MVNTKKFFYVPVLFLCLIVVGGLLLSNQKGLSPLTKLMLPKVEYIEGKFLTYRDIDAVNKNGYVCVDSKQKFTELIVKNIQKLILNPEIEYREIESGEFISMNNYWKVFPEYFSFLPSENAKVVKCSYYESTGILDLVEDGKSYELGYFKQKITKNSFNQLVNFLISARIIPTVPTEGFNLYIESYSSKTTETEDLITRIDTIVYSVWNDTPPFDSAQNRQSHTYSVSLKNGAVNYSRGQ